MSRQAHVILPDELLKQIDRVAGRRQRSRFVEAAVKEKLSRDALGAALEATAGVLHAGEYSEWATPEQVSA